MTAARELKSVEDLPVTLESRIRTHIARRDQLASEMVEIDVFIAADARRFADEQGLTVKPTLAQLRRHFRIGVDQ